MMSISTNTPFTRGALHRTLTSGVVAFLLVLTPASIRAADVPREARDKIEATIAAAYQAIAQGFPCRIKSRGKPRMLRWEEVDHCVNGAVARVEWDTLSRQLEQLRVAQRLASTDFSAAVDLALSAGALAYDKVFTVNDSDVLLPLTNSILKYLPADSLQDLQVIDKAGTRVGTFMGTYAFERKGGLATANTYTLIQFQYQDGNGNAQSTSEKLLLDSFGVPWKDAKGQRGFRVPIEKLLPGKK